MDVFIPPLAVTPGGTLPTKGYGKFIWQVKKFLEVLKNYKNKNNKDLINAMDYLTEDFDKTKDLLLKLSKHLDITEETYYKLLEEFNRRHSNGWLWRLTIRRNPKYFYGICVANDDPLMLGRVRIYPDQQMIDEVIRSVDGFNEDSSTPEVDGPWSILDPFVYLPLLPYFINQIPQEGEYATLFYFNNKKQMGRNKYYMISTFSSPTTILKENYRSSKNSPFKWY